MRLPAQESKHFIALYSAMLGWCAGVLDPEGPVPDLRGFLRADTAGKAYARDIVFDEPETIDAFLAANPHSLEDDELELVAAWRTFVYEPLLIERNLKRFTVFLDRCEEPTAYGVLSLTQELVDLLPSTPPVAVEALLLPWKGQIVCDGLIRADTHRLDAAARKSAKEAYRQAKARGILTELAVPPWTPPERPEPDPTQAFLGRWRVTAIDGLSDDALEQERPAVFEVADASQGHFSFALVRGEMDWRISEGAQGPLLEFSWAGSDEYHPVAGRGRARIVDDGTMRGCIFRHHGEDSPFVAERER